MGWGWRGEKLGSWTEVSSTIALNRGEFAINELCEEDILAKPATCSDRTGVYLCPIFCRQDSCRDVPPSYSFASYIPPRMARNTLPAMSHVLFHTFVRCCRKGFAKLLSSVCALTVIFLSAIPYTVLCHQLFLLKYV